MSSTAMPNSQITVLKIKINKYPPEQKTNVQGVLYCRQIAKRLAKIFFCAILKKIKLESKV